MRKYPYNKALLILSAVAVLVYGLVIILIPDFITDDYYIFTYINGYSTYPISLNPEMEFFLFIRPLSYLSFWIDYTLFSTNAVLMKFHSLVYLLGSVVLVYYIFKMLSDRLGWNISNRLIIVLTAIFATHFDMLTTVFWISNRTEILSFFFYLSATAYFLREENHSGVKYLTIISILYLLSILAKQSSLHLPLVMIILEFVLNKNKLREWKWDLIRNYSVLIFIMIIFSIISYTTNKSESVNILTQIWKKPFSFIGTIGYSFNTLLGDYLYNYFLFNKLYALIVLLLLTAGAAYLLYKTDSIKRIIPYLLILIVSAFPRLFVVGGRRLNTIQIFLLLLLVVAMWGTYKNRVLRKFVMLFALFWLSLTIITTTADLQREIKINEITKSKIVELNKLIEQNNGVKILVAPDIMLIPYQLYYYNKGEFGKADIDRTSLHYRAISYLLDAEKKNCITAHRKNEYVVVKSTSDTIILDYDKQYEDGVISTKPTTAGRMGFSEITLEQNKLNPQNKVLIYYNGEEWAPVN